MKHFLLSICLAGSVCAVWAQPRCNADGTVTFRYENPSAKNVMVDVQFAGRHAMSRDAEGVWTATLGPAAPDMYPYCFIVDGVSVMDPQNPQYFPNEGFKNSLLEIKSREGALAHDILDVPHGSIEYVHYYSKSLGSVNNAVVYLPPSYYKSEDAAQRRYPVFYLISGTTDTEEVYYKVGRVNYILDNLLAEGKAQDMIVVLPYGNPTKLLANAPAPGMPQTRFGGDPFSRDLNEDLMPYIESHYRTIADRDHRAIGGFSRGGNQALFNGLSHLDKFSYLCSYSSFTSTDIPSVYDNAASTNSQLHLFWLGVGTDDFLYGNARDYMQFLDDKGIRSVKEFTTDKFGHTWMNAKYFLSRTLPLLFKPEAAAEAMRNGSPAPAATGKEPQFTANVMARLFPRPIVSPEYAADGITFRFKAPEAHQVTFESELSDKALAMQRDSDGVWSLTLATNAEGQPVMSPAGTLADRFKYCFVVDGMRVTDPNNMNIASDYGFKYSVAAHTRSPYHFASQGNISHGKVTYNLGTSDALYQPENIGMSHQLVTLVCGKDESVESWFKVGGVDALADRLVADGKARQVIFQVVRSGADVPTGNKNVIFRAEDYATWPERRAALAKLLLKTAP